MARVDIRKKKISVTCKTKKEFYFLLKKIVLLQYNFRNKNKKL